MNDNGFITVADAAAMLGVTRARVCQYLRDGRIPGAHKPGGRDWQIPESGLAAFAALERRPGAPRKEREEDDRE